MEINISVEILQIAVFLAAFVTALAIHPAVFKLAVSKRVLDNPNDRKLQRNPVPLLGGVVVCLGMVVGLSVAGCFIDMSALFPIVLAMVFMLCVGTLDDIAGLSPTIRFVIEIAVVVVLLLLTEVSLSNFHGLWGTTAVPMWFSAPLTIFAVVGMINAINLIDGVDGLSSGFCILASALFAVVFARVGNLYMLSLCAISIGALLPFFVHNVFGIKTKMFIGDGGTLMMGVVMSTYVVITISQCSRAELQWGDNFGVIPFTMAVFSVPVFDTLRVMAMRIIRRTSPFHPDKTHLHHLFVDLGFSHVGTTISVLSLNCLVVVAWFVAFLLGASINMQLYVVIAGSVAITFVFYKFMRIQIARDSRICKFMRRLGGLSHFENKGSWLAIQRFVDRM